jgi:uncharacterized surface protein with fasciclin (FAS1) repeats
MQRQAALAALVGALSGACAPPPPPAAAVGPPPREGRDVAADVFTALAQSPRLRTFTRLVQAAGLEPNLRHDGEWTVLAPTDEAFERLPAGTLATLLDPGGRDALSALVKNHLVEGRITSDELRRRSYVESIQGSRLAVAAQVGRLRVEGAHVMVVDREAANGVVHALDVVLVPRAKEPD